MRQRLLIYLFFVGLTSLTSIQTHADPANTGASRVVVDDEYDQYRKKGDDLFKAGRYAEARRLYQNCLEVPGFENDEYAKQRIKLATDCLALLQQADEALQSQNDTLLLKTLNEVLTVNPADGLVQNRLAEYYELKGSERLANDQFFDAIKQYEQALTYARLSGNRSRENNLETQIKTINNRLDQRETERETSLRGAPAVLISPEGAGPRRQTTPRQLWPKIGLGTLAVGAGVGAFLIHQNYLEKREIANQLGREGDPEGDGFITNPDLAIKHKTAESQAIAARRKVLQTALMGVAALATLTEAYLIFRKPKARLTSLFWQPATTHYGLAVGYRF